MSNILFNLGIWIFGRDGLEARFPISMTTWWPMGSNNNALLLLKNTFFHPCFNVSWHSIRHFPQFHSLRYEMLQGVCEANVDKIEACLKKGWNINDPIDYAGKYNAASLAAHLNNLEILHLLDLHGADLNCQVGQQKLTPLMTAVGKFNVRIVDYLIERGVDPTITDKYGFTALRNAQIRKLKTITSMLQQYQHTYNERLNQANSNDSAILTHGWEKQIKDKNIDLHDYVRVDLWKIDNEQIMECKPSQFLKRGDYPGSDYTSNQVVFTIFSNDFLFFNSKDHKYII